MAHSRKEIWKSVLKDKTELKKNVVAMHMKVLIKAVGVSEADQENCPKSVDPSKS